jgi:hypothetical protein
MPRNRETGPEVKQVTDSQILRKRRDLSSRRNFKLWAPLQA